MLSKFSLYFDEVARQGSIRQASERLRIASSAIDRQILQMEARLDAKLFERTPQGVRLTAAGELLLDAIRRWRREMNVVKSRMEDLRGLRRGEVTIAVVEGALEFLSSALAQFHEKYPGIAFRVHVAGAQSVTDSILKGEADVGLTVNPGDSIGLRIERTLIYQVGALVPPGHPLAGAAEVSVIECNDFPLVVPAPSISLRAVVDEAWRRDAGTEPHIIAESDSIAAMKLMAKTGVGVALLTRLDARAEIRSGTLVFVPFAGKHIPLSVLSVISGSGRALSVPASLLLQHLSAVMMAEDAPNV